REQQAQFIPSLIPAPCQPSYGQRMTTLASDWNDIDAVVDHIRALRRVDKISLIGWSQGGPRSAGYAAQHPEKILKMVLLAPAYTRSASADPPALVPAKGVTFNTQSRADLVTLWNSQTACPNQWDGATRDALWSEMLASDPVGSTWGPGVRRAPEVTSWGWT